MILLRDYQAILTDKARDRLRARVRRLLLVAPTGAGKTVIAAYIQGRAAERSLTTWFVVHRIEIILRTMETFAALGINFGVVADGFPLEPDKPVQICSVETLVGRLDVLPHPDGIVFDEAHHIVTGSHSLIAASAPAAWHILITATPERLDGQGLGAHADEMILGPTTGGLMQRGFLSPYRYFAPGDRETLFGNINLRELAEQMGTAKLVGDAVEHWHRDALGMRTIGFEMNRAASQASVAAFRSEGVEAWHIDGYMHRDQRRELFTAFRTGQITYLSQVAIAGEGVDIPGAECALLRYKTNSLTKFLQDVGRVFRPVYADGMPIETDEERLAAIAAGPKPSAVILDMGGNAFDFGMPCQDRTWSLQGAKERKASDRISDTYAIHQCPVCFQVTASVVRVCPCGHEFRAEERNAAWAAGQLFELTGNISPDKEAAAAEKEARRKREKEEERGASLGALMALAHARNQVEPGRYKDPRKWAAMRIKLRAEMKAGGRRRRG